LGRDAPDLMTPLATLRRRKLLTQADLAKAAGVGESTIRTIESGSNRHPRIKVMRAICDALDVQPVEIDEFQAAIEGS
jgi:DNA-binding XRE family transcriptional regulator